MAGGFTPIPKIKIGTVLEDLISDKILVWNDTTKVVGFITKEDLKNQLFPPEYNFDLTSPNWTAEGVIDEASFINWLATRDYEIRNDLTNIVVANFAFVENRIQCNMTADGTVYDLSNLDLLNADKIGEVSSLTTLYLNNNQIVDFNPTIALPSVLNLLVLNANQMTTASYTLMESWATALTPFSYGCTMYFEYNIDSANGTTLKTILESKNCYVIA